SDLRDMRIRTLAVLVDIIPCLGDVLPRGEGSQGLGAPLPSVRLYTLVMMGTLLPLASSLSGSWFGGVIERALVDAGRVRPLVVRHAHRDRAGTAPLEVLRTKADVVDAAVQVAGALPAYQYRGALDDAVHGGVAVAQTVGWLVLIDTGDSHSGVAIGVRDT